MVVFVYLSDCINGVWGDEDKDRSGALGAGGFCCILVRLLLGGSQSALEFLPDFTSVLFFDCDFINAMASYSFSSHRCVPSCLTQHNTLSSAHTFSSQDTSKQTEHSPRHPILLHLFIAKDPERADDELV